MREGPPSKKRRTAAVLSQLTEGALAPSSGGSHARQVGNGSSGGGSGASSHSAASNAMLSSASSSASSHSSSSILHQHSLPNGLVATVAETLSSLKPKLLPVTTSARFFPSQAILPAPLADTLSNAPETPFAPPVAVKALPGTSDIAVVLPWSVFSSTPKSYRSYLPHIHMASALAHMAECLAETHSLAVSWTTWDEDEFLPVPILSDPITGSFRLFALPDPKNITWPTSRFSPNIANVRPAPPNGAGTPRYNSSLLTTVAAYKLALAPHQPSSTPSAVAIVLAWAGSVVPHTLTRTMAHGLLHQAYYAKGVTPDPSTPASTLAHAILQELAASPQEPLIMDPTDTVNLAAPVPPSLWSALSAAASTHLATTNEGAIALPTSPSPAQHDVFITIALNPPSSASASPPPLDGHWSSVALQRVTFALSTAFERRLVSLRPYPTPGRPSPPSGAIVVTFSAKLASHPVSAWSPAIRAPYPTPPDWAAFWESKSELRRFEDGSLADVVSWTPELTAAHKEDPSTPPAARLIRVITTWALSTHGPPWGSALVSVLTGESLADAVHLHPATSPSSTADAGTSDNDTQDAYASDSAAFVASRAAWDSLINIMRELPSSVAPLSIINAAPTAPALRSTAVHAPKPHPLAGRGITPTSSEYLPLIIEPLTGSITLEGSSKWPQAPAALRKMKTAYLVAVAAALRSNKAVVWAAARSDDLHASTLDVAIQGYIFRLSIYLDKEAALLDRLGLPALAIAVIAAQSKVFDPAARKAAKALRKAHVAAPAHAAAVNAVASAAGSWAYAPAVRLAARWIGAQAHSFEFPLELVELTMAIVWQEAGESPPTSPASALLAWLSWLASSPWVGGAPLYLPSWGASLAETMGSNSQEPGQGPLRIITPIDHSGTEWSSSEAGVTKSSLKRLARSAAASANALVEGLLSADSSDRLDPSPVFQMRATSWDAAVVLNPAHIPGAYSAGRLAGLSQSELESLHGKTFKKSPLWIKPYVNASGGKREDLHIGHNTMDDVLVALQERYSRFATFHADAHGGRVILIKWRTAAWLPQNLNTESPEGLAELIALPFGAPDGGSSGVPNVMAILSDISSGAIAPPGVVEQAVLLQ